MDRLLNLWRSVAMEHRRALSHELPLVYESLIAVLPVECAQYVFDDTRSGLERSYRASRAHILPQKKDT
jgi:hypothetical protein